MANDASKVRIGERGVVYHAPLLTVLPVDTVAALGVGFLDVGYISEDGLTGAFDQSSSDVRAWGGDLVRRITNEFGFTMSFTMIEHNTNSVAAFYGGAATATSWEIKSVQIRKAWVAHITDGVKIQRLVVPDGEVTERGDIVFATSEVVGYEVTVTAYPNAAGVYAFGYATA